MRRDKMRKLIGVATGFLLLLPIGAGACEICKYQIVCNPNCEVIEYCAAAPWLKGSEICEVYWHGCQTSEPCQYALQKPPESESLLAEIFKNENAFR
jgi:hypothetical protein